MQYGRQRAEWDRAAGLIVHIRRALGDATTQFTAVHPHYVETNQTETKRAFKALSREAQKQQQQQKELGR